MTFDHDEEPTKPDGVSDPHAAVLARLYGELAPLDRKRLARLVEAWFIATLDQRILIEWVAFELTSGRR